MSGRMVEVDADELARLRAVDERAAQAAAGQMPAYGSGEGRAIAAALARQAEWIAGQPAAERDRPAAE